MLFSTFRRYGRSTNVAKPSGRAAVVTTPGGRCTNVAMPDIVKQDRYSIDIATPGGSCSHAGRTFYQATYYGGWVRTESPM